MNTRCYKSEASNNYFSTCIDETQYLIATPFLFSILKSNKEADLIRRGLTLAIKTSISNPFNYQKMKKERDGKDEKEKRKKKKLCTQLCRQLQQRPQRGIKIHGITHP